MRHVLFAFMLLVSSPSLSKTCGGASWYGNESGRKTANGEVFNPSKLTAAHRTLPFGTRLTVYFKGRSVTVRINDRGPFIKGRILDLSKAAAKRLGLTKVGVGRVCYGQ